MGEHSFFKNKNKKEQGNLNSLLEGYKMFYLATARRCQYYMMRCTFDFLYFTEGERKKKKANIPFTKTNKQKHRARRVEEVRLSQAVRGIN